MKGGWRVECMLNILPRGVGREISNRLSRLRNGSIWGGLDIAVVMAQPHMLAGEGRQKKKITWQLLGEALIDGNAPGSVSIWTWLTRSHMKHSSLAAIQERDAHRKLGSILFRKAPGEHLHRHSNYLFVAILRLTSTNLQHTSNQSIGNLTATWRQPDGKSLIKV